MKQHKDLPPSSQQWAKEVDQAMARIKELEAIVRRLSENAGIDMSNPRRGMSSGAAPTAKNPVGQKLSSLADVDSYNVLEGQVLSWSQQGQKWLPINPPATGAQWELATEEEHLYGELDNDSDYYSTQVMGLRDPYPEGVDYNTGGTGDSYGLVGTSTTSAFLHGAQRFWGGPTRAHGWVTAQPYYCSMGVTWINDETGNWSPWGEVAVDREDVYITTPKGGLDNDGNSAEDGAIVLQTNWFYPPRVNGSMSGGFGLKYPKRPIPEGNNPPAGPMCYDMTLQKPIFWNGTEWRDAMGNSIPAPAY